MAVYISSMQDFINNIGVSGEKILTADLDAIAEGFDQVVSFGYAQGTYNLDGHKISNLMETNLFAYGALNFTNGQLLNILDVNASERRMNSAFTNCKISMKVTGQGVTSFLSLTDSAVDITFASGVVFSPIYTSTRTRANIVIRNATVSKNGVYLPTGTHTAVVMENCTLGNSSENIELRCNGSFTYCAFHNCTVQGNVTVTSTDATQVLCAVPSGMATSVVTQVSEAQLRDKDYLESIGFLP